MDWLNIYRDFAGPLYILPATHNNKSTPNLHYSIILREDLATRWKIKIGLKADETLKDTYYVGTNDGHLSARNWNNIYIRDL
jgi:hypothetical protein